MQEICQARDGACIRWAALHVPCSVGVGRSSPRRLASRGWGPNYYYTPAPDYYVAPEPYEYYGPEYPEPSEGLNLFFHF